MDRLIFMLLIGIHTLSAAAWFGALVYRTFFVDPKSRAFFANPADYENYSLKLAHGMRIVVSAALTSCGASGFLLLGLKWDSSNTVWLSLMGLKIAMWLIAFAVFAYISWVYWPKRVFAIPAETRRLRTQGLILALTMIAIAASGFLAGQLGRTYRESPLEFGNLGTSSVIIASK